MMMKWLVVVEEREREERKTPVWKARLQLNDTERISWEWSHLGQR